MKCNRKSNIFWFPQFQLNLLFFIVVTCEGIFIYIYTPMSVYKITEVSGNIKQLRTKIYILKKSSNLILVNIRQFSSSFHRHVSLYSSNKCLHFKQIWMEDSSKSVGWWCNPLRIKCMRFTWSLIWSFFCITYLYIWSWWSKTTSDRGCYRHIVTQAKPFDDKFTGLRDTRGKYVVSSRSYLTHEDYKEPNNSYRLVAS